MPEGLITVVGTEPCALSLIETLLPSGFQVQHYYQEPIGLLGSSRDIGLTYPELGEPWERLDYALGESVALEFYRWSKLGIESLEESFPQHFTRGSRLSVTRTEQESKLVADDGVKRSKEPVNDSVRLMSGAASSNYAPIDGAHQASFETHALSFTPVKATEAILKSFLQHSNYRPHPLSADDWGKVKIASSQKGIQLEVGEENSQTSDLLILACGLDCKRISGTLEHVLTPLTGLCFRSPPLKEGVRSSVQGITASWGYERYRFDTERRLLACGINPGQDITQDHSEVDEKSLGLFLERAAQLFTDFEGEADDLMRWNVNFTASCDGLPVLGPLLGEPRIQVMAGFAASAWSRGWGAGKAVAQAILEEPQEENTRALLERCSTHRFFKASC